MSPATLGFSAIINALPIAKCGLLQRAAAPWQLHVYRPVGKWLKSEGPSKGESRCIVALQKERLPTGWLLARRPAAAKNRKSL
jgi:hypothetical protein